MTALRRSVLFERNSKRASSEIKRESLDEQSDEQTSDRSGVHARAEENAANGATKPSLLSWEFIQHLVESTLTSRI